MASASQPQLPVGAPAQAILVIDDDPPTRDALRRMLQRLGYAVVVAGDGRAGLECVRERPAAIGLVLLDLTMPGLSGFETLRRLQELNPRLPVVICSGYGTTGPASGETLRSAGAIAVLAKPFELTELSSLLRRTTGRDA